MGESGIKVFLGAHYLSIDDKGRISVPAKFRDILITEYKNQLILSSFDNCLVLYPGKEWMGIVAQAREHAATLKGMRRVLRRFYAMATECSLDKQGRLLLSPAQRGYADIKDQVVVVGCDNKIEIWSKESWEKFEIESKREVDEMADKLSEVGF